MYVSPSFFLVAYARLGCFSGASGGLQVDSRLEVLMKQENNLVALKVAQTRARISMLRTEMALRAEEAFSREMHMERERERDMARDRERDRAR